MRASSKNPAAVALGRLGGTANTKAQNAARAINARKGSRPRLRPRCAKCEAAGRTCYHIHPMKAAAK